MEKFLFLLRELFPDQILERRPFVKLQNLELETLHDL